MKFLRVAAVALAFAPFCFAVNKDLLALQRDLEARFDQLQQQQQALNSKVDVLTGMLNTMQNDTRRTADQVAGMQDVLKATVANSLGPVNNLGTKVEATGEDVRSLRDALADLGARLERMDAKITDLKNQMQIMQNPPAAPGTQGTTGPPGTANSNTGAQGTAGQPGAAGPPAGVSAAQLFTDARRDQISGNTPLAVQEYQQYLAYFPNTEYAAQAQYRLGEIAYAQGDYRGAVQALDAVLERYPQNSSTRDAALMKGKALAKSGQRTQAVQELRALIQKYPGSEQARQAQLALADKSLFPSSTASTRRR
ncbi:MAG TPA: tetratricopeptide repeat protein [Bryobacteraceae bacterium]|jgi:TolA-binding protein|nr:tetratricopeptide repeat protein [Bryobacteraceae bacterium]